MMEIALSSFFMTSFCFGCLFKTDPFWNWFFHFGCFFPFLFLFFGLYVGGFASSVFLSFSVFDEDGWGVCMFGVSFF